jgi:Icc-related predicted phosphoesterase
MRGESEWTVRQPDSDELITNVPRRPGGLNLDGKISKDHGLRFLGLGGSIKYRPGPNQYTQRQMKRRVNSMVRKEWIRGFGSIKPVDVFIAHSPPAGVGDEEDSAHEGFAAFHRLIEKLRPTYMLHGHVHPHGFAKPDRQLGETTIINVIPHRVIEIP